MLRKTAKLYDPIRKKFVSNTPEERVRQKVLHWLLNEGGYPASLIAVETGRLMGRCDIVCYLMADLELVTALIIECKAHIPTQKCWLQVLSYAPEHYYALAWPKGVWMRGANISVASLYSYAALRQVIHPMR